MRLSVLTLVAASLISSGLMAQTLTRSSRGTMTRSRSLENFGGKGVTMLPVKPSSFEAVAAYQRNFEKDVTRLLKDGHHISTAKEVAFRNIQRQVQENNGAIPALSQIEKVELTSTLAEGVVADNADAVFEIAEIVNDTPAEDPEVARQEQEISDRLTEIAVESVEWEISAKNNFGRYLTETKDALIKGDRLPLAARRAAEKMKLGVVSEKEGHMCRIGGGLALISL